VGRYKLAAIVSHPIQYQIPLFRALAAHPDIDLHVFFGARIGVEQYLDTGFGVNIKWDIPLDEGYQHTYLKNWNPRPRAKSFLRTVNPAVIHRLLVGRFDAVWVHGWSYMTNWMAIAAATVCRIPIFIRGDSNGLREPSGSRLLAKRLVLGALFRSTSAFLAIGTRNREFYERYGASEDRIFATPYSVDDEFFLTHARELNHRKRQLKQREGINPDIPAILFSGKLIEQKRPFDLLKAFADARRTLNASLLFVGDGTQRREMESFVRERAIPDVHFLGFRNQCELPACYAMADLFVLPSAWEPWGLVVNEAMCFGLPVIVSNHVGAAPDLVEDGVNGYVYPAGDCKMLADKLETVLRNDSLRHQMGQRSAALIQGWGGTEASTEGILRALQQCCGLPGSARG
jgi:glycosyltransferase involved in cell wall biosynthesis